MSADSNLMQSVYDALDAIGRYATPEEVAARCPYRKPSINRALWHLHQGKYVDMRGSNRKPEYAIASGSVRPIDRRGRPPLVRADSPAILML